MERTLVKVGAFVKITAGRYEAEGEIVKIVEPGEVMSPEELEKYALCKPGDTKKPYGNKPLKIPRIVLNMTNRGLGDDPKEPHYGIAPIGRDAVVEIITFAPSTKPYNGEDMVGESEEKLIEIKCPKCGNTDLKMMGFVEDVPVIYRSPERRDGNTLTVDASKNDMDWESSRATVFLCRGELAREKNDEGFVRECLNEFPIPDGVEIDWV